jgi:hypothetical protein
LTKEIRNPGEQSPGFLYGGLTIRYAGCRHSRAGRKEILPRLAGFIRENALKYDPVSQTTRPESWTPANDNKPLLKKKNYPDLKN